jgi:hypothetical protein
MEYQISINPLVDFFKGTESKKRRIIRDQKDPSIFRVGWYQTSRACIRKSLINRGERDFLIEGIERLKTKIVSKPQQVVNRQVSIEAMKRFLGFKIPAFFKNHNLEIIKEKNVKSTFINNVEVKVSPDIIFIIHHNETRYIGAVKLHLSSRNIFDSKQSRFIATILNKYLLELSDKYNAEVLPELCLSIDVFGSSTISAPKDYNKSIKEVELICEEIKSLWRVA